MGRHPTGLSRRDALKAGCIATLGLTKFVGGENRAAADLTPGVLPGEPVEIGSEPQFLHDLHIVDCTWALDEKKVPVQRVFHACRKHATNPWFTDDAPSHLWVSRDNGVFRMWYQMNRRIDYGDVGRQKGQAQFKTFLGYAQSNDGIEWERPSLDLFAAKDGSALPRNCVLYRPDAPQAGFDCPALVVAPERDRRGYRYLMLYIGTSAGYNGVRLIGSPDGIHWDMASDIQIAAVYSDHHNTIVYDPTSDEYVLYLRAKHIYLAPGQGRTRLDSGQSRRGVARMTGKELWTTWSSVPQTIIVPDEIDADAGYNHVYGMPTHRYAGITWGFFQSFRMNDYMHVQLAWSRDGINFQRPPHRPELIEYGEEGSWDDTMLLACPNWIEVGDEWWIYYNGWDGPHGTSQRNGGIGLAKLRKEGFVSLRGPKGGGVVCTRAIRWPGGDLQINASATDGALRVRVSDALRKPITGYNYDDGEIYDGDSVRHAVKWGDRSLDALKGKVVRLEFFLKDADLYTFCAASES